MYSPATTDELRVHYRISLPIQTLCTLLGDPLWKGSSRTSYRLETGGWGGEEGGRGEGETDG